MHTLQSFIISWSGKHDRALKIAAEIQGHVDRVTIVWSDRDPSYKLATAIDNICRPDDQLFADKFVTSIENCTSDILLLIHADCSCDSWATLVDRCRAAFARFEKLNAWAPQIDHTFFQLSKTEIVPLPDSDLSIVAQTDAIVLAFKSRTIPRLLEAQLRNYKFGWGICWLTVCHSYANGYFAAVDREVFVKHDVSRGYQKDDAAKQRDALLDTLSPHEKSMYTVFNTYLRERNRMNKKKNSLRGKTKQWLRRISGGQGST